MKNYVLRLSDGITTGIRASDDDDAIMVLADLPGSPVIAEQWDSDGWNDRDQPCKRILFWADDESAQNDDGKNAIAELSTVGNP